jgi:hypothetical protein
VQQVLKALQERRVVWVLKAQKVTQGLQVVLVHKALLEMKVVWVLKGLEAIMVLAVPQVLQARKAIKD